MTIRNRLHSFFQELRLPALATAGGVLCLGAILDSPRHDSLALDLAGYSGLCRHRKHDDACAKTAFALRQASLADARSDLYVGLAKGFNDPDEDLKDHVRELNEEYRDAQRLASAQYRARLQVCKLLGEGPYDPEIDAEEFSTTIDNKFYPLVPGRTMVYQKKAGGETETITISVLKETIEIEEIECVQVRDVAEVEGEVEEDTVDFYAQHENGDVWYIGEVSKSFEDGFLDSLEGSWRLGKDGAKPGILMLAKPTVGKAYRQEFLPNEAEDCAVVVSTGNTVNVPAGTFTNCIATEDFTAIEPGLRERKFYAPGVGLVLEVNLVNGERTELVKITNG